ncbi:hypothetical protein [Sediminibacterium ginsengisoli]|uniref:Lipocalin-like domain-containing protein n=1 Tax=Sediminibacterium ginsengisoli TaxID=413434 RepID=A0A1T4JPF8_9BACT|nr:hypothetical protein [Sediminibacterium ginsengisoli]SJZ31935.1 hypothetical protein SAMN04488132_10113 [Sediminibacterium ginsengisoli]
MRRLFILLIFFSGIQAGFCQTTSLVGTWQFSDSAATTSFYFQKEGSCFIHKGLRDGVILTENLRKGTYELKDSLLTIKWADNSLEKRKLVFIDKDSFRLSNPDKLDLDKNDSSIFKRMTYEGIVEIKALSIFYKLPDDINNC